MALRSQKTNLFTFGLILLVVSTAALASELTYSVRRERALNDHHGTLTVDNSAITFQRDGKEEKIRFEYGDVQQLWLSDQRLIVLTYRDRPWLLGIDQEYEFYLLQKDENFRDVYVLLKDQLDRRFVSAIIDPSMEILWEVPAKLPGKIQGSEGVLQVAADRVVFRTERPEQSRTWRDQDIENITTSGPFELTLTSHERAKSHYGSLKSFNFRLKQPLDEGLFQELWRRLNANKGLQFLRSIEEGAKAPE